MNSTKSMLFKKNIIVDSTKATTNTVAMVLYHKVNSKRFLVLILEPTINSYSTIS